MLPFVPCNSYHDDGVQPLNPPEFVFIRGSHQERARRFVPIAERVGNADGCLLQPPAAEAEPALRTLLGHEETKDVLAAVAKPHHTLVHGEQTWTVTAMCRDSAARLSTSPPVPAQG